MKLSPVRIVLLAMVISFFTYISAATVKLWVFGDSTVKDYTNSQDACSSVLKVAGWGEFIMEFLGSDSLGHL